MAGSVTGMLFLGGGEGDRAIFVGYDKGSSCYGA
jgi:hypothetical protein